MNSLSVQRLDEAVVVSIQGRSGSRPVMQVHLSPDEAHRFAVKLRICAAQKP